MTSPKRPRDTNQLAKFIVDIATGDVSEIDRETGKDADAMRRGRLGGAKGGEARAAALSPQKRKKIAKAAAKKRWGIK